jgi:monoamine oxidase
LGLRVFKTHSSGTSVALLNGETFHYEGVTPITDQESLEDLRQGTVKLEKLAASIPLEAPWTYPHAAELDRITFADWIEQNLTTETGRWAFNFQGPGVFSCETSELSMLHVAFYYGAGGGVDAMISTDGGGQDSRFETGMQQLSIGLAAELGENVLLGQVVNRIDQDEGGVRVHTDGLVVSAERVIVALSPTLAGRIRYSPPMPPQRDSLTQRMPMGTAIKMMFRYATPFWRDAGMSGMALTDRQVPQLTYDNSPDDASCGILLGFTEGAPAREWWLKSRAEREARAVDTLVQCFGPKAAEYVEFIEQYWAAEEFSRGCYAGTMPPGAWTSFGPALSAPVGRIHWAGTETATCWNGYVEGAMQAGERAAAEVLKAGHRAQARAMAHSA